VTALGAPTLIYQWQKDGTNLVDGGNVSGSATATLTLTDVQTTVVPPGGATMVELKLRVPANYVLVDHALSRLMKGAVAIIKTEGEANAEIFRPGRLQ